jgi:hypothetical protein
MESTEDILVGAVNREAEDSPLLEAVTREE